VAADRGWPRGLRRAVAATLGVAVAAGVAGPAFAGPSPPVTAQASWAGGRGAISTGTLADSLRGLPVPDRAAGPATAGPRPPARAAAPRRQPVVIVHRGDSLWSISADLLPRRATDRDITEAWHRLHRANSGRIGTDPALILPGTRLAVPELSAPHPEDPS